MKTPEDAHTEPLRLEDAVHWLHEVEGRLMCKRDAPDDPDGWVAIVKTPAASGHRGQVILGFGDSAVAAVQTARESWQDAWREISTVH